MTIYVLMEYWEYEGGTIWAVYQNREDAETVSRSMKVRAGQSYEIEEHNVIPSPENKEQ